MAWKKHEVKCLSCRASSRSSKQHRHPLTKCIYMNKYRRCVDTTVRLYFSCDLREIYNFNIYFPPVNYYSEHSATTTGTKENKFMSRNEQNLVKRNLFCLSKLNLLFFRQPSHKHWFSDFLQNWVAGKKIRWSDYY